MRKLRAAEIMGSTVHDAACGTYTMAILSRRCVTPSCTTRVWYASLRHNGHDLRPVNRSNDCRQFCHTAKAMWSETASVLGQDQSETKKDRSWSWSCRSGVVLRNTVLLYVRRHNDLEGHSNF